MDTILRLLVELWNALISGQLVILGNWSYLLLALLVLVEGPIATLLGAAAASAGLMQLDLVFISAGFGNLTADMMWYTLGYAGKTEWLYKYGRWFGLRHHHLDRLRQGMVNHAPKILLLAKLTAGFIIPSLIAAGLARVPWKRWFPAVFTGEMIWTGMLVLIGFYATESIKQTARDIRYVVISSSILFFLVVVWMIMRALRNKRELEETRGE